MAKITRRKNSELVTNKFTTNLTKSDSAIKGDRARIAGTSAEKAQRKIIDNLIEKQDELILEQIKLSDLNPTTNTSLIVGDGQFNGTQWAEKMHEIKVALLNVEVELEIAEETYEEWFAPIAGKKATSSSTKSEETV